MPQTKPAIIKEESDSQPDNWRGYRHRHFGLLIILIVVVIAFTFGLILGHGEPPQLRVQHFAGFSSSGPVGFSKMPGQQASPMYSRPYSFGDGNTNQDRLEGVVTSVNGASLTIAGDGTTNTVQTNSSTQYLGGSSAAVNDTVVVLGSNANNSFTASQIYVNP